MVRDLSRQQLEIYLLLKENLGRETTVDEITERDGLNIKSYTERITELRVKGFQVLNTRKNHYTLEREPSVDNTDIRFIYKEAKKRGYTKLMTRCIEKYQDSNLMATAREVLL